jgi:hypothetical protein
VTHSADKATDDGSRPPLERAGARWNVPFRTLGGKQLWADVRHRNGWRVQQNVVAGHFRLLDPHDVRRAWGTLAQCNGRLDEIARERSFAPPAGKAVVVLHGLIRTRSSMKPMSGFLTDEGYHVLNVSYPSTRAPLAVHAANLASIIEGLQGVDEIHFVAHSLGNLVVRHYLGDLIAADKRPDEFPLNRFGRMTMIAPPNNGARLAVRLGHFFPGSVIFGATGRQLGAGWSEVRSRLAIPGFEFGVIAGGLQPKRGRNPFLLGDDDFVVSVEETRLRGAADFLLLRRLHTFIMKCPATLDATLRFLQTGCFRADGDRQPIE